MTIIMSTFYMKTFSPTTYPNNVQKALLVKLKLEWFLKD